MSTMEEETFREEAEFVWKIENYSLYPQRPGEAIESPLLSMGNPRHSIFCVRVYPRGPSKESEYIVTADFVRLHGTFNCQQVSKISLVAPNGDTAEGEMSTRCRTILWINHMGTRPRQSSKAKWEKTLHMVMPRPFADFMPDDTLTLRCKVTLTGAPQLDNFDMKIFSLNLKHLYERVLLSDLTLHTDDNKEFPVLKCIIKQRAPELFNYLGLNNSNLERVKVSGISSSVLNNLLQYLYCGEIEQLPADGLKEILKFSEMYNINIPDLLDLTNEVVNLGGPTTIRTHLKFSSKEVNWTIDEHQTLIDFKLPISHFIHFGKVRFLVLFFLENSTEFDDLLGTVTFKCLSDLEKDVFLNCHIYMHFKEGRDCNSFSESKLHFPAGSNDEQICQPYNFYKGYLGSSSELLLRMDVTMTDCSQTTSVDGLTFVYPEFKSHFGLNLLRKEMVKLFDAVQTEKNGDVTLLFEDTAISAHKGILAAWSPVFAGMFNCDMTEKLNASVNILDVDYDTALRLIKFMYHGSTVKLSCEEDAKLYAAADKYQVTSLVKKCSSFLKSYMSVSHVCSILTIAYMHCDEELMAYVREFIGFNREVVLNSREWDSLINLNPVFASVI